MQTQTKKRSKGHNPEQLELRIQSTFTDVFRYQDFLLNEVGIITRIESNELGHSRGTISSTTGPKATFLHGKRTNVYRYALTEEGARCLILSNTVPQVGQPVTFTRHLRRDTWVFQAVVWCPEEFEKILDGKTIYRLVSCTPMFGKLYRPGRGEPRKMKTLWEGTNLESLRQRYPQDNWQVRHEGSNPLHFEIREQGSWKVCNDPR